MKIGDPKHTYKALLWDYEWLLTLSDDECSYCLSEREVQILLSIVEYVGWKTRYIRTLTEPDQSIITEWSGNLARKLMSGCCGDEPTNQRYTADGYLEQSFDGGETWERDNSDPRFNSPIFPPLPGADGDDKKCAAAASAAAVIDDDIVQKLEESMTAADILALIALVLLLFLSGGSLAPLIVGLVSAILATGIEATKAAFTTEVWDTFRCILYCNMADDGSFTEAQWQQVKADIFDQIGTSIAQTFLITTVNAWGPAGLTNAARSGRVTEADCSDCDCTPDEWCRVFDFTIDDQGWSPDAAAPYGVYDPGIGWRPTHVSSVTSLNISIPFPVDGHVTRFESFTTPGFDTGGYVGITYTTSGQTAFPLTASVDNPERWENLGLDADCSKMRVNPSSGSANEDYYIYKIVIRGTGANPFGSDNCV